MNPPRVQLVWRRMFASTTAIVYLAFAAILAGSTILTASAGRSFFTDGNMSVLATGITVLGFVAIGQTLVILIGSLDLSVPFLVSLSSVLAAGTMGGRSQNLLPGIALALLATTVLGVVSGLLVGLLKINGFMATLGVGLMVSGYLFSNYKGSTGQAAPELALLGSTNIGFLPVTTLIMLVCLVVMAVMLSMTRTGLHIYAVGGDAQVARMSGVHSAKPVIVAHALSGLFSGLAGLVIVARLGVGSPTVGDQGGYDLLSIAAVILGGALLSGGRGSLWGSLGGILVFACLDSVMGIMQLNPYLKDVVRGLIIISAVALYARRSVPKRAERFPGAPRTSALEGAAR
jgi:ribose transport system permease protein